MMEQNDFYEVNGCSWFIPVDLIEENKCTKELKVATTESGRITFVPTIYKFPKPPEPQKPVVPKFVAEWYERNKDCLDHAIYSTITGTYRKVDGGNNDLLDMFETWLAFEDNSILTLVRVHLFGYEIEQEKLYTVEIPNPNSAGGKLVLFKQQSTGRLILDMLNPNINKPKYLQLTESEIKHDFDFLWQFAKPVEEN